MHVQLTKSELQRFVTEKVQHGDFPSPVAVVEDALMRMMEEEQTLTSEDINAIDAAEEEINQGHYVEFDPLARKLREKYKAQ